MKRFFLFSFMIIIYMSLSACGKKENNLTINTYSSSAGFLTHTSNIAESENGFYILSGKNSSDKFITYLDKKTNESTVLCSKINCDHSIDDVPSDCDSYIGSVLAGSLNFYNGYVYYIGYDTSNYECNMYRISASGSEHEMICKLGKTPDNSNDYYSYVITDKYVIYSESISNSNKKNTAVLRIYDLKNKSVDTLYSFEDNNAKIFDLKVTSEVIYFRQANSDGFFDSKLYAFNVKERIADLVADKVCSYSLKNEKTTVYWKSYDGIYENDIDNKSVEKIYSSDEDTMIGFLASSGEDLYIYNFSNGAYKQETGIFIGILKDNEIVSKVYVKGEQFLMPLYIGKDRIITAIFDTDGRNIGYCLTGDKSIDADIINCGITY